MPSSPSQPTTQSGLPSLVPHGRFKGKPAMPLGRPVTVIGGRSRSHLHLVSQQISKSHAMVVNSGSGFYVRDLASRTHIFLNGQQVTEAVLKDGDILAVGPFTFRFTDSKKSSSSKGAQDAPPAVLRASNRAVPVSLDSRVTIIGRRGICDVSVDEPEVSTTHAVIFEMNGKRFIRDLGSRTGTFVNGTAVHQQPLDFGDEIKVGSVTMSYVDAAGGAIDTEPDITDDLDGTAALPAVGALDLDEPVAPVAAPRASRPATPVAPIPVEDDLDLELAPAVGRDGDGAVAPLTPFESTPDEAADVSTPVTSESATESALGIELLPHDEVAPETSAASAVPTAPAPAAVDSDFGLDFAEPAAAEPAPPVPTAADLAAIGPVMDEPPLEVPLADDEEDALAIAPAEAKAEKSARWERLLGPDDAAPAAPESAPAEPVELTPDVLEKAEAPTAADAVESTLELEPAALDDVEVLEKTEPTPESALDLDADAIAIDAPAAPPAVDSLTDSMVGREVEAFEGPGLGPIVVEEPVAKEEPAAAAEVAPAEVAGEDDALIYEDVAAPASETTSAEAPAIAEAEAPATEEPASEATAEAPTKRRGGRKATRKPAATPKRKPPTKKGAAAAAAAAAAVEPEIAPAPVAEEPIVPVTEAPAVAEAPSEPTEPTPEVAEPISIEAGAITAPSAEVAQAVDEAVAPLPPAIDETPAVAPAEPLTVAETAEPTLPAEPEITSVVPELTAPLPVVEEPAVVEAVEPIDSVEPVEVIEPVAAVEPIDAVAEPAEVIEPTATAEPVADTTGGDPLVFEASPESVVPGEVLTNTEDDSPPVVEVSEVAAPVAPTAPAGKPTDLFFGLERDAGSFLGGMPLALPPLPQQLAPPTLGGPDEDLDAPSAAAGGAQPPTPPAPVMPASTSEIGGLGFEAGAEAPVAPPPPVLPAAASLPGARAARPAPPPPARSAGRGERSRPAAPPSVRRPASPFDVNFDSSDKIEIPPFAGPGPATRGQVTTAFDGLAMPPVREADVFSQKPFASGVAAPGEIGETPVIPPYLPPAGEVAAAATGDDDAFDDDFDDEPLDLSTADDDLDDRSGSPADDTGVGAPVGDGEMMPADGEAAAAAPAASPDARKGRPAVSPPRRPAAYPSGAGAGGAPQPAKKKRWRIGKWGLFGVMLLCMGAASIAIWFAWPRVFPNHAQLTATLRFDNLDQLTEAQRQQVLTEQRRQLERPEVRAAAREILASNANTAGTTPGFLSETGRDGDVQAAAVEYVKLTDSLKLLEKKPTMQLKYPARDGESDRVRVVALLDALHAENKPLIDRAGELRKAFEEKSAKLMLAQQLLKKDVRPRLESARSSLGEANAVTDKQAVVEALQRKEQELLAAWNETTRRVKDLKAEVMASESAIAVEPGAAPGKAAPTAEEDSQVVELARRVEELNEGLAAKRQKRAAQADEARKAMAAALKQFEDDIANARGTMQPDSELGRYLERASRVQSQLTVLSNELAAQQRSDMERLLMLKRKLAEKNETRIRNAFASDADLQALQETLAMKERQFNAAQGGGYRDDAKALDREVKGLKLQIESRQDLLTTADGIAPDMKVLEDFINETLARMDSDRARNDRNMAAMLKELAAQTPAAGSLPQEQKAFAEQLERRQAELNKARERFTAASDAAAAEANEELKSLETELAAAQAKVDERKKQVADAARKQLSQEQQRERLAETDVRRRDLYRAQASDQAAADAYWANRKALNDASDEFERLTKRAEGLGQQQGEVASLENDIKALSAEVDKLRLQRDASVVPVAPTEDDVMLGGVPADHRPWYIMGCIVAITLVFVPFLIMAPTHVATDAFADDILPTDDGTEVPYAAPASDPDDSALAAAQVIEDETERRTTTTPPTKTSHTHDESHDESPVPA